MWTRGLSCTTTETPALCVQSHHANIPQPNPPSFNPDPTICRVGDDYFLATSTFEYFPGVPVYHSRDLINWKIIGHVLNRKSKLELRTCEPGGRIYAPTLRYDAARGRWYMTTAALFRQSMRNEHDVSKEKRRISC
jgi:beta-xylosidase